jgi:hypothetical protein
VSTGSACRFIKPRSKLSENTVPVLSISDPILVMAPEKYRAKAIYVAFPSYPVFEVT